MEAMSKKEKLARGSAVIKVMRVIPRPGHYLQTYMPAHNMPRAVKPPPPKGTPMALLEMPYLDVKNAAFDILTTSAKIPIPFPYQSAKPAAGGDQKDDPCDLTPKPSEINFEQEEPKVLGLPEGHRFLKWFAYRDWAKTVFPPEDGNIAEHFNILLGLLITMAKDAENENFPDAEAYPCVQFLRTIKTPDGEVPYNVANFISYIEYICMKIIDEA